MYVGWLLLVTSKVCCHGNGSGLYTCVCKFHEHTYTVLYAHSKVKAPEGGCYWLRVCYIAMTMVMLDYMYVRSFMII